MPCARKSSSLAILLGSSLSALALPTTGLACAVCFGSSPEDYGYFWGVLFLMSMPFTVGGVIGGWLVYAYRRSRNQLTSSSAPHRAGQRATTRPLPGNHQRDLNPPLGLDAGIRRRGHIESSCCHAYIRC